MGGMLGPIAVYLGGALFLDQMGTLGNGWAIPCATDIAFSYMIVALQDYLEGQRGDIQFGAAGKVRVSRRNLENGALLEIAIESGWHINANETLGDLVPTRVVGKDLSVQYPDGISRKLAFVEAPCEFYEGELSIMVHGSGPFTVELQACDNSKCLAPEKLVFP